MGTLYFLVLFFKSTYHTSRQNIQILVYLVFKKFSELCYNKYMINNISDEEQARRDAIDLASIELDEANAALDSKETK
jgi:hypothetical protein